jgi:hypothetical protein
LNWIHQIVENYSGNEPRDAVRNLLKQLMTVDESNLSQIAEQFRSKEGIGSSLKMYQAGFLESHLVEIAKMPISIQRKIHEFRNQLYVLNQEIPKVDGYMKMTFDSSMSEQNHQIIKETVKNEYIFVQEQCKRTADKIAAILLEI